MYSVHWCIMHTSSVVLTGGVMVSVLASSVVDHGFEPRSGKPKNMKLVFVASTLSTQHKGERAKMGWFGTRKICQSEETHLSVDCCFSELAL
jgi:hypothetical protein